MAYLLEKKVCPSSPKKKERSMTMAIFLSYSVENSEGGHGISSREKKSALPIPKKKRRMTMVTYLLCSVESCEGGHGLCHHLLVLRRRGVTMAFFFLSSVES